MEYISGFIGRSKMGGKKQIWGKACWIVIGIVINHVVKGGLSCLCRCKWLEGPKDQLVCDWFVRVI